LAEPQDDVFPPQVDSLAETAAEWVSFVVDHRLSEDEVDGLFHRVAMSPQT